MANTERRCVRCGIRAQDAAGQNEPICSDHGLVAGHSYRDVTVHAVTDPSLAQASATAMAMDRIDLAFAERHIYQELGVGLSNAQSQELLREEEVREAAREQARLDMEAAGVPNVH